MADNNSANGSATGWIIGIIIVLVLLGALSNNDSSSTSSPSRPAVESTEDKLRRVYDSQGIDYDDRMIREDARAIEQLHREFGQ
jgi:hypothetical protein